MSSILVGGTFDPATVEMNSDGGLEIIGRAEESNVVLIEDDGTAPNGGEDFVTGGFLGDVVQTSAGNDIVATSSGDDIIFGGDGADILRGEDGDDVISGGAGADIIIGGEGMDIFDLAAQDFANGEVDRYLGFEGGETDLLRITGVSEDVTYDADSGEVLVGDQVVARIGSDLHIEVNEVDPSAGTWELF